MQDNEAVCRFLDILYMLQLTTILFLISFSLLAVLHVIAIELYLYWHFFWFDIFMHFFGGTVVALGVHTLADLRIVKSSRLVTSVVVGAVFLVAVVWEVFELSAGVPVESDFILDTTTDLLVGLCGAYIGHKLAVRLNILK
ncbi:MAG: hypothetical protein RLZZ76_272 [Candidatus Parcubacteria bacterium]